MNCITSSRLRATRKRMMEQHSPHTTAAAETGGERKQRRAEQSSISRRQDIVVIIFLLPLAISYRALVSVVFCLQCSAARRCISHDRGCRRLSPFIASRSERNVTCSLASNCTCQRTSPSWHIRCWRQETRLLPLFHDPVAPSHCFTTSFLPRHDSPATRLIIAGNTTGPLIPLHPSAPSSPRRFFSTRHSSALGYTHNLHRALTWLFRRMQRSHDATLNLSSDDQSRTAVA